MRVYNKSAVGYNRAGENLGKALAVSFLSASEIHVAARRDDYAATLHLDGERITLSGKQIDGALGIEPCFALPPMADKPLGLL